MESRPDTEVTALLSAAQPSAMSDSSSPPRLNQVVNQNGIPIKCPNEDDGVLGRVLPLAFTTAFAIAATSATSIYAYSSLTCKDPMHCRDDERNRYASIVAAAGTTANVCGVLAVLVFREWTETHPKHGLCFWLISRGLGVGMLAIGVVVNSIYVAVAGRIFEGLANDNLLHYALAAIYVRTKNSDRFSRLMGTSLALYMAGTALSPTVVTLLPNFFFSFVVAMAVLVGSLCYLFIIPIGRGNINENSTATTSPASASITHRLTSLISSLFTDRATILPTLAIFFYNTTQSYLFPLIMVHAALNFGFGSAENGYIVSIAALTSSIYLLFVLYLIPKLQLMIRASRYCGAEGNESGKKTHYDSFWNWAYAIISMAMQMVVLPCFMAIRVAPMVYVMVMLVALGLAAPGFIKSYAVEKAQDRRQALASLAIMESLGGMLSPVVLGLAQSLAGSWAFAVASCLVGAAILSLVVSAFIK